MHLVYKNRAKIMNVIRVPKKELRDIRAIGEISSKVKFK